MKVTNDGTGIHGITGSRTKDEKTEAGRFDAILRKTVEEKAASLTTPAQSAAAVTGPSPIDTATLLGIETSRIVDGAEELLSTLEEFQTKLGDTGIPLDDLSPLVERMNTQKDALLPSLDALPESDPLRDIVNRVLIACSVEAEKFKRGDYL